jgi:hypothetical protein
MPRLQCSSLLGLCVLFGCGGGPTTYPVSGTVTLHGKAQDGATVRFQPLGDTPGHGGHGITDDDGKFEVIAAQTNHKGLPAGNYKVVISRMRRPDGSPPYPNVPPIESDAGEKIPDEYSSMRNSTLKATIGTEATVVDFHLPIKKK